MQKQQEKLTKKQSLKSEKFRGPLSNKLTDANTGVWRLQRPIVDFDNCVRCNICANYCPCGVIEKDTIEIDYYFCKGCGICVEVCPKNTILFVNEQDELEKENQNG